MIVHNFSEKSSIINHFVAELRSKELQKDAMRFRRNIERIGELLAFEVSKTLIYDEKEITTPMGTCTSKVLIDEIVLCSVLRAGLPLHNGLLNIFDHAENAFISAYRHHTNAHSFEIVVEYLACPDLNNKTLILADPMLATGQSMVSTFEALEPFGKPKAIHLISVIGSTEGLDYVSKSFPEDTHLWISAVDTQLNDYGYIVPGLGDAGDLAFGKKLQN